MSNHYASAREFGDTALAACGHVVLVCRPRRLRRLPFRGVCLDCKMAARKARAERTTLPARRDLTQTP